MPPFFFWFGYVSIPGIAINHWVFVDRNQGSGAKVLQESGIPLCIWHCCQLGQKEIACVVRVAEASQGASSVMLSPQDQHEIKQP